jgi:hypothetical protein
VFRQEGDYWLVVFDDHTARVRDLKGMRHLARLIASPGREFLALDLVAAEAGKSAQIDLGNAGTLIDARAKAAYRRRLTEIDEDSSKTRGRAGTPNGRHKPTPSATSSSESSHARSGWAVEIAEPVQRPNAPGWPQPVRSARR